MTLNKDKDMQVSFILQATLTQEYLNRLYQRASEENSQFKYMILTAKSSIDQVVNTYHEVLERDNLEDSNYRPPLRGVE
tara:strand:- start:6374 stop:6610 length:237 start_codon:yes stop_codon:yes gene_type:complete